MDEAATYREMDQRKEHRCAWTPLMRAANAGDEAAYKRVLAGIAPVLRAQIRNGLLRTGAGADEVEDILQETLLAIHLKRHTWREAEPFTPWMRAIARNKLIDALRRRGSRYDLPIDDFSDVLAAPEEERPLSAAETGRMLGMIDGRPREVVQAIAFDGLTARETATHLGMTEGAVRVALHRGIAALSKAFRKQDR
jgi:RNA polymerase sigma-70 factor (ECF subfamily)